MVVQPYLLIKNINDMDHQELLLEQIKKLVQRLEKIESLLSLSKETFNINDLELYAGISKSTIYKKTSLGLLDHYKQANHLFFDKTEIDNWLKSNKGFNAEENNSKAISFIEFDQKDDIK